ncbi:MAG TPA: hypothetical protein DF613_01545 [Lachnospiraceae bacterium]|nr:hypothetical protein [Lachnospiraceae bacterium]
MISIIVPIYNIEKYLSQCLKSICGQTYKDIEIILVNDGSTDGSGAICEAYKQKDSRIHIIHRENGGPVSARKAGVRAASGRYIAFVDGDDWIESNMYEDMYQISEKQKADVVMCGRYEDTGDVSRKVFHGIPEGRYEKKALIREVYPCMIAGDAFFEWGIFPGLWDKLFRRECIERFLLAADERIRMGDDAACVYPSLLNADSIYVMHECLYHYRQTTSSTVKKVPIRETERKQFSILYQSVRADLRKAAHIFDLRQQWKKYVLFLMLPRADGLYEGYGDLDYLFPFPGVKRGFSVILYGAGTYGQRLYRYLQRTGFCRVAAWVDRNYMQFQNMGLNVENPAVISQVWYDAIVIANTYDRSRQELYRELAGKYPEEKIHMLDENLVFSQETMNAFGLAGEESDLVYPS